MNTNKKLIFRQLFEAESSTYTYLLGDEDSREAIIIDSVLETAERDLKLINELGLKLKYILDTHIHADHVTGAGHLRTKTGAILCVSDDAHVECADLALDDGQEIKFGTFTLKAVSTPGHTSSCMTFLVEDMAFTGDTLLIRGCGRTDFQSGSSPSLFQSVHSKIFTLPPSTRIFPAHDYKGFSMTTVGEEMSFNPRLKADNTEDDFVKIMSELKLANPKKIDIAVPSNLQCGKVIALESESNLSDAKKTI